MGELIDGAAEVAIPYGSVASGMEMAHQALGPLNFELQFVSEIEAFPCGVMGHRIGATRPRNPLDPDSLPTEKERKKWIANNRELERMTGRGAFGNRIVNEGDFTKINPADYRHIRWLIGGPPCQSFSVAGARRGLQDHRGNLTLAYVGLVHELAATGSLRGAIYENVPGLLSDKSNAFGCFLGALVGHDAPIEPPHRKGRWTDAGVVVGPVARAAWRVLDAQHFGLAQRRRRLFVVICFGDGPDPARILFERKRVPGAAAPGGEPQKDPAGNAQQGPQVGLQPGGRETEGRAARQAFGGGQNCNLTDKATAVTAHPGGRFDLDADTFVVEPVAATLTGGGRTDGSFSLDDIPLVPEVSGTLQHGGRAAGSATSQDAKAGLLIPVMQPVAATIDAGMGQRCGSGMNPSALVPVAEPIPFDTTQITCPTCRSNPQPGDPCHTLSAQAHAPSIAFREIGQSEYSASDAASAVRHTGGDAGPGAETLVVAGTITASYGSRSAEDAERGTLVAFTSKDHGQDAAEDLAPTLRAMGGDHANGGGQVAVAYAPQLAHALRASDGYDSEDGTGRQPAMIVNAFSLRGRDGENQIEPEEGDVAPALRTGGGGSSKSFVAATVDAIRWAVRRLMPHECERLQGSADHYTKIPWRGRPAEECPDGPRYKVIGNSFPMTVIRWLGVQIIAAERALVEEAS